MDDIHRQVLQQSLIYFMKNLDNERLNQIQDYLFIQKLIGEGHLERLAAEKTCSGRVRLLIVYMLPKTGPRGYQCFIDALSAADGDFIVKFLKEKENELRGPHGPEPVPGPSQDSCTFVDQKVPSPSYIRNGQPVPAVVPPVHPPTTPTPCIDPDIADYLEVVVKGKAEMELEIQRCRPVNFTNIHNVYDMSHSPHGHAVIISNRCFMRSEARHGTQFDATNLEKLFRKLNFEPILMENQSSEEIMQVLENEQQHCNSSKCDALFIFILSHGDQGVILGTDEKPVTIDTITGMFDTVNCPGLAGKPKIFIFQACQGGNIFTTNIRPAAASTITQSVTGTDLASNIDGTGTSAVDTDISTFITADTFILRTVVGYTAFRDPNRGGWFLRTLAYVFAKYAHEKQLFEMFCLINLFLNHLQIHKEVSDEVVARVHQCAVFQSTCLKGFHFCPWV